MQTTDKNRTASGPDPRPIRFLHIPKTAGTSLNIFLDRFHPPEHIFVFKASEPLERSLATLRTLGPDLCQAIRLYRGHAPLTVGDPHVDGARTFTFLRDPVSRVVSFCHHLAEGKKKSHMLSEPSGCPSGPDFDLDSFLSSGEPELENLQTRMLVGEESYRSLKLSGSDKELRAALSAAFSRLEFVGVQEKFEEGLLLASLAFGWWPSLSAAKRSNVRSPGNLLAFTDTHLGLIRKLNRMDAVAHDMARSLHDERRRRSRIKLAALKTKVSAYGMLVPLRNIFRS